MHRKDANILLLLIILASFQLCARENISIVGSSTVYPFSTVVAERFGKATRFATPTVEATGSGGGIKLFCQGVGPRAPDIANSSRRIKSTELALCEQNGVTEILEVLIGYDGIVLAGSNRAQQLDLTPQQIYLGLAKHVPSPVGNNDFILNPHKTWGDVSASLPAMPIRVLGPPPTSGTRDAFVELAMEAGCHEFPYLVALEQEDPVQHRARCHSVREDGHYIEAGENDNLIVQKLASDPSALGIFGYSFLEQNLDQVKGSRINGFDPSFDTITRGQYPVSRPLYFYVKIAHIDKIPGIREFLYEFISDKATGKEGYLLDKGLIPLTGELRNSVIERIRDITPMVISSL